MSAIRPASRLDLRGTPCPMNYVRARLALEGVPVGGWLQLELDPGEPEEMVSQGLRADGHHVETLDPSPAETGTVLLLIRRGG
ncbi:MAG: sulfurtransferase TusA family protein [Cyanobacteriota bacterium]